MSDLLKLVIAGGGALVVGLIVGVAIGSSGKGDLEAAVKTEKQRASSAELALKEERADCERKARKARISKLLLQTKEQLLRALVELQAVNYGLASQHLANARDRIRVVQKKVDKKHRERAKKLFDDMASTQTLVMRQDPMARKYLQDLLHALRAIPGGR